MADPTEQELLAGLRARQPEAGRTLVRLHYRSVYRFLTVLTCDAHRAEDLTQETFAAAWAGLDGFHGDASLRTWLQRIAYRKFANELRSRRRHVAALGRLSEAPPRESPASSLRQVLADETLQRLAEAMEQLSATDRAVLAARYVEGLKSYEAAKLLGKPAGTVRSRIHKALRRLRGMLDGQVEP